MLFALTRRNPWRDCCDGVRGGMGAGRVEAVEHRQPFEISPCRKDDLDLTRFGAGQHIGGGRPEQPGILGRIDAGLGMTGIDPGEVEMRVEGPRFLEIRAPARERHQRIQIER